MDSFFKPRERAEECSSPDCFPRRLGAAMTWEGEGREGMQVSQKTEVGSTNWKYEVRRTKYKINAYRTSYTN